MTELISFADVVAIVLSLLAVVGAGMYGAKTMSATSAKSFILAGRSLTLPVFVASLVATWYGSVLGATEFIVQYGIVFLLCFGLPYYIIAIVYANWLTKRIRQSEAVSIPDQIGRAYGPRAAMVSAGMMLLITIPASYQLSLALITQHFTDWSLGASMFVSSSIAFLYVVKGGLRADAFANIVQVILMYLGYTSLAFFCMAHLGSITWVLEQTPTQLISIPGPLGWTPIIVWIVIALQTFVDPNFHVRTAAAADAATARKGVILSVGAWIAFDLLQLIVGLYALTAISTTNSMGAESVIVLALSILPNVWRGVFLAGVIAAVMSSLDGYALVSGTTLGHDLFPGTNTTQHVNRVRLGVAISLAVGGAVALTMPSVVELLYRAASITVPAILAPLLVSYTPLASRVRTGVITLIVVPALVSLCAMLAPVFGFVLHPLAEPMLVGIVASAMLLLTLCFTHDKAPST